MSGHFKHESRKKSETTFPETTSNFWKKVDGLVTCCMFYKLSSLQKTPDGMYAWQQLRMMTHLILVYPNNKSLAWEFTLLLLRGCVSFNFTQTPEGVSVVVERGDFI